MSAWPLPDVLPRLEDYRRLAQSNVIRKAMSVGEPKSRRRSTRRQRTHEGTWILTDDQLLVFEDWFRTDIADGSLSFDWSDPEGKEGTMTTWFSADPQITKIAPNIWSVQFALISVL